MTLYGHDDEDYEAHQLQQRYSVGWLSAVHPTGQVLIPLKDGPCYA